MFAIKERAESDVLAVLKAVEINNDDDLEDAVNFLEALGERLNKGESQLKPLVDLVLDKVTEYEDKHYPIEEPTPVEMLKFLMDQHGHERRDLYDIDNKSNWSQIFNGKRELNLRHIRLLSKKYHVNPSVFFMV